MVDTVLNRLLLLATLVSPLPALGEVLTLEVTGVRPNGKGEVIVCLFRNGEHWLDMGQAFGCETRSPDSARIEVVFDVPAGGHYAAQALHDENGDGKPNFRIFPPKFLEGFAFSNGYRPRMKPNYDKAKFEPEPGATGWLDMSY